MYQVFTPHEWIGIVEDEAEALFWRAFGYTVELVGPPSEPL